MPKLFLSNNLAHIVNGTATTQERIQFFINNTIGDLTQFSAQIKEEEIVSYKGLSLKIFPNMENTLRDMLTTISLDSFTRIPKDKIASLNEGMGAIREQFKVVKASFTDKNQASEDKIVALREQIEAFQQLMEGTQEQIKSTREKKTTQEQVETLEVLEDSSDDVKEDSPTLAGDITDS